MINTWTIRSVTVALAGLALAVGGSRSQGQALKNEAAKGSAAGATASTQDMAHNFNVLRFGAPCLTHLKDGSIFPAFWCNEDCVSNIRRFKQRVEG